MIVSVAMDVLPVCLSPMISSRCPRPIGNMESIERIPVSRGTVTDLRSMIPGAGFSIGRYSSAWISPFPSIGSPSAFTILPINLSPTGIPACLPVLATLVPSLIPVSFPKRIHPMLLARTSCTIPFRPFSKVTTSPYMA